MSVGVLQVRRNADVEGKIDITGAAYGEGAPGWTARTSSSAPDGWEDTGPDGTPIVDDQGNNIRVRRWTMELRADYEHPLHPGSAVGFVLGEMPGGKVTGWIEDGLTLNGEGVQGVPTRLAIDVEERAIYKAVLGGDQKKTVDILLKTLDAKKELEDENKRLKDELAKRT